MCTIQQGRVAPLLLCSLGQASVERGFPICAETKVKSREHTPLVTPPYEIMMDGWIYKTIQKNGIQSMSLGATCFFWYNTLKGYF